MTSRTADCVCSPSARQPQHGPAVRTGAVAIVSDVLDAADLKMYARLNRLQLCDKPFILLLPLPRIARHHAEKHRAEQNHRDPIDHAPAQHSIEQHCNQPAPQECSVQFIDSVSAVHQPLKKVSHDSHLNYLKIRQRVVIISISFNWKEGISIGTYADAREKTRSNLIKAFWELYCEKDINKITIKEITDRAGYNRATFYIYFKNAQQVLDYVEDQLYQLMKKHDQEHEKPQNKEEAERMLGETIMHLDANRQFLCVLLSERGDPKFAKLFRDHFRSFISRIVEAGQLEATVPLDFALDFILGGIVNSLQSWYETQPNASSREFIQNMFTAAFYGMFRIPDQISDGKPAVFCR